MADSWSFCSTFWHRADKNMYCLQNCYLLGVKNIPSHAHKTGSWYLLGFFFKFSMSTPHLFSMGVYPFPFPGQALRDQNQNRTIGNVCRGTSFKHPEEPTLISSLQQSRHLPWKFLHNVTCQFKMPWSKWKSQKATVLFY